MCANDASVVNAHIKWNTDYRYLRLEIAVDLKKYRIGTLTDCMRCSNRFIHNLFAMDAICEWSLAQLLKLDKIRKFIYSNFT